MGDLGGSNNEAVVTGPGSVWSNRTRLVVGNNGTVGHRLTVSNGAAIWCGHPITGSGVGGASNQVIITGAGSLWTNQADFSVGGVGTWLQVNNGGWLANANGYMFSSNTVALSGSGSGWNNRGDLQIGYFGDGCTFMASNGATVLSSNAFIGAFTSLGNNNFALLTGAGTLWSNQNNFTIGDYGVGNRLVVSDGGTVFTGGNGVLGVNSGANTNSLVITGSGTRWLGGGVVSSLLVGSNGSFNQMTISTGAQVTDRDGIVGSGVGVAGSNNTVLVTGAGSQWSNSSSLVVGSFSSGNRLDIGNFGLVENQFGTIGTSLFASNNEVVVHDPGAIWSNGYSLTIGESGNFNRLTVTNGGTVFAGNQIVMGFFGSSFFNRILVDGGTLRATNATGTAFLDVRRGTNVLNSGTIDVDLLVVTNNEPNGKFEFNGGTLITRGIMRSNDTDFVVNGIGATPATWDLRAGVSNHYLLQSLIVGSNSSFNQLLITNGGSLTNAISGAIGLNSGANSNLALLSGAGSVWSTGGGLYIGFSGSANQLVVSNGAQVINQNEGHIGSGSGATDNAVLVTGAGSLWKNMDNLFVGFSGTASRLVISDGGTIFTPTTLRVGTTNSRVVVDGGTVSVTNASGSALLTVVIGTHVLNAGFVEADQLSLVFASGIFEFNGGTLKPGRTTCGNGRIFTVGDGTRTATLQLAGGTHAYTNGLLIANNGTLTGFGTIAGQLTVSSGATLAPGNGIGTLIVTGMANLSGTTVMEAFKLAGSRFSDLIQVSNTVIYGGSLIVSNVGLASFTAGDSFKLFNATAYAGFFASLNLPPLDAGLGWTNKLLVDGSIEVIAIPQPKIGSITVSGTSVIIAGTNGIAGANYAVLTSTNVTIPMTDWLSLVTNQFDASGNFSITNPIASGELQSFFRIRTP
jgi:T5SS/PEP-CTERM-associated repeat protein